MRTLNFNRIGNEADASGVVDPANRTIWYWGFGARAKACVDNVWKKVATGSTSTAVFIQSNEIMPLSQACHSLCADPSHNQAQKKSLHFFFCFKLRLLALLLWLWHLCLTNKMTWTNFNHWLDCDELADHVSDQRTRNCRGGTISFEFWNHQHT